MAKLAISGRQQRRHPAAVGMPKACGESQRVTLLNLGCIQFDDEAADVRAADDDGVLLARPAIDDRPRAIVELSPADALGK
jgi:hypothetical protein